MELLEAVAIRAHMGMISLPTALGSTDSGSRVSPVLPARFGARSLAVYAMWSARAPATRPGPGGFTGGPAWRPCWRRALAGACLAAAVGWVGSQVSLTGVTAAGASAGGFRPVAGVSLASAVLPGAADQPTDGTLAISPARVNAGGSQAFTLTFTATMRLSNGTVILHVPAGWPSPTQTPGSPGYTYITCASCTLNHDPRKMTITITGLYLAPQGTTTAGIPSSIAVTYAATVPVPSSATGDTFTASAQQTP